VSVPSWLRCLLLDIPEQCDPIWHSAMPSANLKDRAGLRARRRDPKVGGSDSAIANREWDSKTKPNKAKRVKPSEIRNMLEKFRKQSQMGYRICFQELTCEKGLFFSKNEWIPSNREVAGKTKPNKAKWVKSRLFIGMLKKFRKQSQISFALSFHGFTSKESPFFRKNKWCHL
jgi:hypothetical protein